MNRSISSSCSPARSIAASVHSLRRLTAVWNVSWPSTRSNRSSWTAGDHVGQTAVGGQHDRTDRSSSVAAEYDRSSAVAPQGGGLTVVVVGQSGEHLRADQQHLVDAPDLEHSGGQRQPAQPAAAGGAHVDGAGAMGAEAEGDLRRGVGGHLVLAEARHQDQIDLGGVDVSVFQRLAARTDRQIGDALARRDPAALADPGALDDPLVVDADSFADLGRWRRCDPAGSGPSRAPRRCGAERRDRRFRSWSRSENPSLPVS